MRAREEMTCPFTKEIDGKAIEARYIVADGCVCAEYGGRRSSWTQIGGSAAKDVAGLLLREMLDGRNGGDLS